MKFIDYIKSRKDLFKYIVLYVIFLLWGLILCDPGGDELWNYGFCRSIFNGLIPYKDFNMILTPLFPFLMSIGFHIFGSDLVHMHIISAMVFTFSTYFLFDMFKDKTWIILFCFFFPIGVMLPNYNLLLFIFFVLIIYMEKKDMSSYLIGFIIGLMVLTKQTIGVVMFIVSLLVSLFYKDKKDRIFKRIVGFIIPCFVFLIYLFCSKSLYPFLDQCLFGLFDFTSGNAEIHISSLITLIIGFITTLYFIYKNPKDIVNYYCMGFYIIVLPLFDLYHTQIMMATFMISVCNYIKKDLVINMKLVFFSLVGFLAFTVFYNKYDSIKGVDYPNDLDSLEYKLFDRESISITNDVNNYLASNNSKKIIFLSSNAYYFKLINNKNIDHFDLINKGNMGYNGHNKLINRINKNRDAYYLIDRYELLGQIDGEALSYVKDNARKIDSVNRFDVYYFDN